MDASWVLLPEITGLPCPELAGEPSPQLRALDLAWAGHRSLRLLDCLPAVLPRPPRRWWPRSWWRHVYCLASMSARLAPRAPDEAIQQAVLGCSVLQLLAACAPQLVQEAQARASERSTSLEQVLAGQGVALATLEIALRTHWRLTPAEDPVRAARAVLVARWLLALKRMPSPLDRQVVEPTAEELAGLGLGAEGLVAAIASLTTAVEDGRRLLRVVGRERAPRR